MHSLSLSLTHTHTVALYLSLSLARSLSRSRARARALSLFFSLSPLSLSLVPSLARRLILGHSMWQHRTNPNVLKSVRSFARCAFAPRRISDAACHLDGAACQR